MRNKSLVYPPCDRYTLCGINVRFQTVSPTQGQVAHALLTRPPLIIPRRVITVRLECVMHAASVHPEPGSHSRTNCISTSSRMTKPFYSSRFWLFLLFCVCRSVLPKRFSFQRNLRFRTCLFACTSSPVVQLSMINRHSLSRSDLSSPSRSDSIIIPPFAPFVKYFFKSFLKTFFSP